MQDGENEELKSGSDQTDPSTTSPEGVGMPETEESKEDAEDEGEEAA